MTNTPKNTTKFGKGNPGKPKGAVSKNTKAIKDMILMALENAGGVAYLTECATNEKTQTAFLGLVGKVMPMQVDASLSGNVGLNINVNFD